eukprot:1159416-Pelagomonas_calceolata.AAC.2
MRRKGVTATVFCLTASTRTGSKSIPRVLVRQGRRKDLRAEMEGGFKSKDVGREDPQGTQKEGIGLAKGCKAGAGGNVSPADQLVGKDVGRIHGVHRRKVLNKSKGEKQGQEGGGAAGTAKESVAQQLTNDWQQGTPKRTMQSHPSTHT